MKYTIQDLPSELVELDEARQRRPPATSSEATQTDLGQNRKSSGQTDTSFFDAVSLEEAVLLYSAIRHLSPKNSLEVGFCCGGSGLAMLKGHTDNGNGGKHYVCDPFQSTYAKNAGVENVLRAKLSDPMMFKEQFPEEFIPSLPRLQFAFVDASHLFDLTLLEFTLIDKKLDIGGVLAFHDMWMPSLQKIVRYILSNHHYQLYDFPEGTWRIPPRISPMRKLIARVARTLPKSDLIFSQELLQPWGGFGIGNLVFLVKRENDNRDWRHFVRF